MAEDEHPTVHANDQTLIIVQVIWEGFHLELQFISHHQVMLLIYVFIIYNINLYTFWNTASRFACVGQQTGAPYSVKVVYIFKICGAALLRHVNTALCS